MSSKILRPVPGAESLIIPACNGQETLAKASDLFSYIDSDFRNWDLDKPGLTTPETKVSVRECEMTEDATFRQMFGELSADLDKLCLTQTQIKGFVKAHREHLRAEGYATFFLFQVGGKFFVAIVRFYSAGKLYVDVRRFGYAYGWFGGRRHRVVIPQL